MARVSRLGFVLVVLALGVSCAPAMVGTANEGVSVVRFSATQRATIVQNPIAGAAGVGFVCSEPPPDVVVTSSLNLLAGLDLGSVFAQQTDTPGGAAAQATLEVAQAALALGVRTQAIQAQRDALFHICEMHANGALTEEDVLRLFDEVLFTLRVLALAQVLEGLEADSPVDSAALSAILRGTLERRAVEGSGGGEGALPSVLSCRELLRLGPADFQSALVASDDPGLAPLVVPRSPEGTVLRLEVRCAEVIGPEEVARLREERARR